MLHPPTLQTNTIIYKMSHISSRLSETPHPATNLLKLSTPFRKNVTTKTRKDRHSLLTVRTTQLTLHKCKSLLPPLPLPMYIMLFPDPWTADSPWPLLLASCLPTVLDICPTKFVIFMAGFIPPRPGFYMNPRMKNTIITLSYKSKRLRCCRCCCCCR